MVHQGDVPANREEDNIHCLEMPVATLPRVSAFQDVAPCLSGRELFRTAGNEHLQTSELQFPLCFRAYHDWQRDLTPGKWGSS
jgi:hypothetical protein